MCILNIRAQQEKQNEGVISVLPKIIQSFAFFLLKHQNKRESIGLTEETECNLKHTNVKYQGQTCLIQFHLLHGHFFIQHTVLFLKIVIKIFELH